MEHLIMHLETVLNYSYIYNTILYRNT